MAERPLPALNAPTDAPNPALVLGGPLCLATGFFLMITAFAPHAALLPALSAAAIATAMPTALFALTLRERQGRALSLMDVAGGLTLVGCAAAMFSNPESVRQTFALSLTP
jgi:hypothetical protein